MNEKGITIQQIADELGISYKTAHQRLSRAGIKPVLTQVLYPQSAIEAIRNVPGKGRPPKPKAPPDSSDD